MNQDPAGFRTVDVCERDLDFLLAEEIECNQAFRSWFLQRVGAQEHCHEILRLERSVTTRHGETDLLVIHRDANGDRRALLIENKIAASFTQLQPERYRMRGEEGRPDDWENFATVLIAPQLYLTGVDEDKFNYQVSYEKCAEALAGVDLRAAFKRRILAGVSHGTEGEAGYPLRDE